MKINRRKLLSNRCFSRCVGWFPGPGWSSKTKISASSSGGRIETLNPKGMPAISNGSAAELARWEANLFGFGWLCGRRSLSESSEKSRVTGFFDDYPWVGPTGPSES